MTTDTAELMIAEPGVYEIRPEDYHADPVPGGSLSASGARALLPPSCPAIFRYAQDHPATPTREFDLGHAAHREVLGIGPELVVIDADNYNTKAARAERDDAHADGKVPLLAAEHDKVQAMAAALREHELAAALFTGGRPEQSLFWIDQPTGVWLRARLDWLPDPAPGRRLLVSDYKTTTEASLDNIQQSVYRHGYFIQAPWYLDGVQALGLDGGSEAAFLFVFQEKRPPHLITIVELDAVALGIGRDLARRAIETYAECKATDHWPGYADDIEIVCLPAWVERRYAGGML